MTLPPLPNWDNTRIALHQAAQILGEVRKASGIRLPNHAHLTVEVTSRGVTTGTTPEGTLTLDFPDRQITYVCPAGSITHIPLAGHTQIALADAVLKAITDHDHTVIINRDPITGTTPLEADPALAANYANALYSIFTAIARFRARIIGPMSPLNVWPHGFDLSMLWFAHGFVEEQDPHINIGFSPGSPGFPRPYIYVYARPIPEGLFDIKLPEPAYWTRERWTGIVIDYDYLAAQPNHEAVLENLLQEIYLEIASLLQ